MTQPNQIKEGIKMNTQQTVKEWIENSKKQRLAMKAKRATPVKNEFKRIGNMLIWGAK